MDSYQIVPWDHLLNDPEMAVGTVLEQYVPPELEAMAWQVMERYDMRASQIVLITSKPDKGGAIWRIDTDKGPRSIKVLHRTPQRSLFSIGAQDYLVQKGARVPALIPTIDNELWVEAGGKSWIVTDWIDTLQQASKIDLEGAAALCYGLGEFHLMSKGYIAPHGAAKSSRLYGYPKYYQKIIAKIGWFRDIAQAYPETAASAPLLDVIDEFERQAKDALEQLLASSYNDMTAMGEPYWGLAHQDYGWSNGQMGPGGIWVIDLDGVAYDLPFRDLRKLMTSTMDDMGTWDITWIRGMIDAYHQANPLDQQMFDLLWIDMAFPNEFYKHVKEVVFDPINFSNLELNPILQRVLMTESTKWQVMQELLQDRDNYSVGSYIPELTPLQWDADVIDAEQIAGRAADPLLFANSETPVEVLLNDPPSDNSALAELESLDSPTELPSEILEADPPESVDPALPQMLQDALLIPAEQSRSLKRRKRRKPRSRSNSSAARKRQQSSRKKPLRRARQTTRSARSVSSARRSSRRVNRARRTATKASRVGNKAVRRRMA